MRAPPEAGGDPGAQAAMAAALRDPAAPPPPGLRRPGRFDVHRNNVAAGLSRALAATYPAVAALTGAGFFAAAAVTFARAHPPRSPVLIAWGGAFPAWIAAFPPAAGVPYLGDVARLEWARARALHAADAPAVPLAALAAAPPGALEGLRCALHPSVGLLASGFPVASIWRRATGRAAGQADGGPACAPPPDLRAAETALVGRAPDDAVIVRALAPGEAAMIAALAGGAPLGAAAAAGAAHPGFDLAAALAALFSAGLVVRLSPGMQGARPCPH